MKTMHPMLHTRPPKSNKNICKHLRTITIIIMITTMVITIINVVHSSVMLLR